MNRKSSDSGSKRNIITTAFLLSIFFLFVLAILSYSSKGFVYAQNDSEQNSKLYINTGKTLEPIRRGYEPKLLTVKKGEHVYKIFTVKTDIREILEDSMIPVEKGERVSMSTPYVVDGTIVRIIKTEVITEINKYDIPFSSEVVKSAELPLGERRVVQKGVLGVKAQNVIKYFEDGVLIKSTLIEERTIFEPIKEIVEEGTATYSLDDIEKRGYNCPYWSSVIDSGPYSEDEKSWLKYIMYCESGCNAESDKNTKYKGLFQWSEYWWKKQYNENIFDGNAQILHTIEKYRAGAATMWPACNAKYERTH
jgi:hypothetical protein